MTRLLEAPPHASGPGDDGYSIGTLDGVAGDPESIAAAINRWKARNVSIVVAMDGEGAARRVSGLLSEAGADLPVVETLTTPTPAVTPVGIHAGFVLPAVGFGVVGEQEVAGRRRAHRKLGKGTKKAQPDAHRDLTEGDYVVHHHHGIGRFAGLVHREIGGVERDYLLVEYAGEDKLYVPTDQLAAVTRYTGGETRVFLAWAVRIGPRLGVVSVRKSPLSPTKWSPCTGSVLQHPGMPSTPIRRGSVSSKPRSLSRRHRTRCRQFSM